MTSRDPAHPVGAPSLPGLQHVTTSTPSPDKEDGEVTLSDVDIPDSIARALLDALQAKRTGNQLPATMAPLARVRASQLQQCLVTDREPTEAIIQATLDMIAVGQGPADPSTLANKVSMVSHMLDVQPSTAVLVQDSSRSLHPTARAEITGGSLYTAIADSGNICSTDGPLSRCKPSHPQHQANCFRMSANDVPEQLVLRGPSDEDVPAILTQFRKRVDLKGDLHVPPQEIDKRAVRFLPLLLKSVALETYSQLTLGALEWRSENTLTDLKVRQMDVTPVATQTWSD